MLKSVLLSSFLILLTIYSLSLLAQTSPKSGDKTIIASDKLVMKVGSDVFFLQDIENTYSLFKDYYCMNEDSALIKSLFISSSSLQAQNPKLFFAKKFDLKNKDQMDLLLMFYKISKFIDRQSVRVNPELSKLLAESGQANKCVGLAGIKGSAITDRFSILLELDTFFSSRFTVDEKTQDSSVKNFLESISNQIKHEIY